MCLIEEMYVDNSTGKKVKASIDIEFNQFIVRFIIRRKKNHELNKKLFFFGMVLNVFLSKILNISKIFTNLSICKLINLQNI